jgi:hypothetical protein
LKNIKAWKKLISDISFTTPTDLVLGYDAAEVLLDNEKIQKLLDLRRLNIGEINYRELPGGVEYYGSLMGIDIWSYNAQYNDGSAMVDLMPAKKAMLISRNAERIQHYGSIRVSENGSWRTYVTQKFARKLENLDPDINFINVMSAPIFVPKNVNSALVAQVIA